MPRSFVAGLFAAALLASPALAANRDLSQPIQPEAPVPVSFDWLYFSWPGGAPPVPVPGSWEFTNTEDVELWVTDLYCTGDQFEVYDNAALIGTSSAPIAPTCDIYVSNPNQAIQDARFSSVRIIVPPGTHSITLVAIENPFPEGGGGALRIAPLTTLAIPTVSGVGLAILGLALLATGLFVVSRRKSRA